MYKKLLLLPLLFWGLCTFATAQGTVTSPKKCTTEKACCSKGKKAACCASKTAKCSKKTAKTAFVKKTTKATVAANKTATVHVNGVCGMCKMRIERTAKAVDGVASATWDDIKLLMTVSYDSKKVDLESIEKAVAAIGHDTEHVKATDEAYNQLHGCCKYPRS